MVVESRRMSRSTISDWLECKKTAFFAPVERSERLEGVGGRGRYREEGSDAPGRSQGDYYPWVAAPWIIPPLKASETVRVLHAREYAHRGQNQDDAFRAEA